MNSQPIRALRPTAEKVVETGPWRVSRHAGVAGLEGVFAEIAREGAETPFQAFEWVEAWARQALAHRIAAPFTLVVERLPEARVAMILPLAITREGGLAVVGFMDARVSDYGAPLIADGFALEPGGMETLWRAIRRALPSHDLVRLDKMPARVGAIPNPFLQLPAARVMSLTASGVPLHRPFAEFRWTLMQRDFLEDLDSKWRRLRKRAPTTFGLVVEPAKVEATFAALVAQRSARFTALGADNVLDEPAWRDFYLGLARDGAAGRGMARLFALEVEGETIATLFGLERSGVFHCLLPTFQCGAWKNYSPGLLVILLCMEWSAERGLHTFDFTIGDERYKADFGVSRRALMEVVRAGSVYGAPSHALARLRALCRGNATLLRLVKGPRARPVPQVAEL